MNVQEQIKKYIASQLEPKRSDMRELHRLTLQVSPECKLWFFDGKDNKNNTESYRESRRAVHVSRPSKNATGYERLGSLVGPPARAASGRGRPARRRVEGAVICA